MSKLTFFRNKKKDTQNEENYVLEFVTNSLAHSQGHTKEQSENQLAELLKKYEAALQSNNIQSLQKLMQSNEAVQIEESIKNDIMESLKLVISGKQKQSSEDQDIYPFNFSQIDYIAKLEREQQPGLYKINKKYNGLCDLICNYMTANNILGNNLKLESDAPVFLDNLENRFSKTHIIQSATIIQLVLAVLFRVYPNSLLTRSENHSVFKNNTLNKDIFLKAIRKLSVGEDAKFCAFMKKFIFINNGHSMLIKKISENKYIFFDPNAGATKPFTEDELFTHASDWLKDNPGYKQICLINNSQYLSKISNLTIAPQQSLKI